MSEFKQYRRKQIAEIRPYVPGEDLSDRVGVSAIDREAGSPKEGDMIARDPKNHADQWLVAKAYFEENFEAAPNPPQDEDEELVDRAREASSYDGQLRVSRQEAEAIIAALKPHITRQALDEAAAIVRSFNNNQTLQLHAGEMRSQELRSVKGVLDLVERALIQQGEKVGAAGG